MHDGRLELEGLNQGGGEEIPADNYPHRSGPGCLCGPDVTVDISGALWIEHLNMEGPDYA